MEKTKQCVGNKSKRIRKKGRLRVSIKIGMVSLGCPKNQVDAEVMLSDLKNAGYEITPIEAEADVIIVNTCGFIEEAKSEAIENIIEAGRYKQEGNLKALIVTGCLAERYRDEITDEIPEADVVVGIGKNGDIVDVVENALKGKFGNRYGEKCDLVLGGERVLTTPPYTAYLKIAEGCDNCCTYCAIPIIRGRFRSRDMESCINEAKELAKKGVTEIVLVAQDTTRYGEDINDGKSLLPQLIKEIAKIDGVYWVRTLYTYPERISDELLEVLATEEKAVKYLDIPLQHCNGEILKRMNRHGDKASLEALINKIRTKVPDITLRTTLLLGFPGETDEQFCELCEFVGEMRFDRLGCFAYSEEEGTMAANMPNMVDKQLRQDRADNIMEQQLLIAAEKNEQKIDSLCEVLVEGYDNYIKCYFGRSSADAPEIDGKIFFTSQKPLKVGDYVTVIINDTIDYDLLGETEE